MGYTIDAELLQANLVCVSANSQGLLRAWVNRQAQNAVGTNYGWNTAQVIEPASASNVCLTKLGNDRLYLWYDILAGTSGGPTGSNVNVRCYPYYGVLNNVLSFTSVVTQCSIPEGSYNTGASVGGQSGISIVLDVTYPPLEGGTTPVPPCGPYPTFTVNVAFASYSENYTLLPTNGAVFFSSTLLTALSAASPCTMTFTVTASGPPVYSVLLSGFNVFIYGSTNIAGPTVALACYRTSDGFADTGFAQWSPRHYIPAIGTQPMASEQNTTTSLPVAITASGSPINLAFAIPTLSPSANYTGAIVTITGVTTTTIGASDDPFLVMTANGGSDNLYTNELPTGVSVNAPLVVAAVVDATTLGILNGDQGGTFTLSTTFSAATSTDALSLTQVVLTLFAVSATGQIEPQAPFVTHCTGQLQAAVLEVLSTSEGYPTQGYAFQRCRDCLGASWEAAIQVLDLVPQGIGLVYLGNGYGVLYSDADVYWLFVAGQADLASSWASVGVSLGIAGQGNVATPGVPIGGSWEDMAADVPVTWSIPLEIEVVYAFWTWTIPPIGNGNAFGSQMSLKDSGGHTLLSNGIGTATNIQQTVVLNADATFLNDINAAIGNTLTMTENCVPAQSDSAWQTTSCILTLGIRATGLAGTVCGLAQHSSGALIALLYGVTSPNTVINGVGALPYFSYAGMTSVPLTFDIPAGTYTGAFFTWTETVTQYNPMNQGYNIAYVDGNVNDSNAPGTVGPATSTSTANLNSFSLAYINANAGGTITVPMGNGAYSSDFGQWTVDKVTLTLIGGTTAEGYSAGRSRNRGLTWEQDTKPIALISQIYATEDSDPATFNLLESSGPTPLSFSIPTSTEGSYVYATVTLIGTTSTVISAADNPSVQLTVSGNPTSFTAAGIPTGASGQAFTIFGAVDPTGLTMINGDQGSSVTINAALIAGTMTDEVAITSCILTLYVTAYDLPARPRIVCEKDLVFIVWLADGSVAATTPNLILSEDAGVTWAVAAAGPAPPVVPERGFLPPGAGFLGLISS